PQFAQSEKYYDKALQLIPDFCPALSYKTELKLQMGDRLGAFDLFLQACSSCGQDSIDIRSVVSGYGKKNWNLPCGTACTDLESTISSGSCETRADAERRTTFVAGASLAAAPTAALPTTSSGTTGSGQTSSSGDGNNPEVGASREEAATKASGATLLGFSLTDPLTFVILGGAGLVVLILLAVAVSKLCRKNAEDGDPDSGSIRQASKPASVSPSTAGAAEGNTTSIKGGPETQQPAAKKKDPRAWNSSGTATSAEKRKQEYEQRHVTNASRSRGDKISPESDRNSSSESNGNAKTASNAGPRARGGAGATTSA
ncbi:unnamed protein product, partial [Amoebophrya sp. A120]